MPEKRKLEQWPVQSQPTHHKMTPMVRAADMEQIFIQLANIAEKEITEIITCSNSSANASRPCKRNNTNGVCWWHWTVKRTQKTKACAKQNSIKWCQQCNKPGTIGINRWWLAQWLWTEANYAKCGMW